MNAIYVPIYKKLWFQVSSVLSRTLFIVDELPANNFYKKQNVYDGDFDKLNQLTSKLVLLRHEIVNGIITHDILDILRKICSKLKMRDILDLQVQTAVFWKKSDRVDRVQD